MTDCCKSKSVAVGSKYPLDALSGAEIEKACQIVEDKFPVEGLQKKNFCSVELAEIPKEILYNKETDEFIHQATDDLLASAPRVANIAMFTKEKDGTNRTFSILVDLKSESISFKEEPKGTQPNINMQEFLEAEALVQKDPKFAEAMKKRGLVDSSKWMAEPWSAGNFGYEKERNRRIVRIQVWCRDPANLVKSSEIDNGYAHPVSGLVAVVDLVTGTVEIEEQDIPEHDHIPVPKTPGNFSRTFLREKNIPERTDIKEIDIKQPNGASFTVDGKLVSWQGFTFRVAFNWREGLTLHHISYQENSDIASDNRRRPLAFKISCSEMVVPYLSGDPIHARKNAFDMGEYGVGFMTNSLTLGCDCLGEIHYFDAELNTMAGKSQTIKNAICLHEEDYGMLWKHTDWRMEGQNHPEKTAIARSTRLVISSVCTLGNYEYGFFYHFYQDGTIEAQLKATGLVNTNAIVPGQAVDGQILGDGLVAQNHQHAFSFRLDMAVDGMDNTCVESNTQIRPFDPETNPYGNQCEVTSTEFSSEKEAQRDVNPQSMRIWKVVNENKKNRVDQPTAYKLTPGGGSAFTMLHPGSPVLNRAAFMKHHLWVTPYSEDEMFAAGRYPNQSTGEGVGLENWTSGDRNIKNTDIVLWHTCNMHHLVRLEDYPVMPVEYTSFTLKPCGFFDYNPTLRVPAKRISQ